MIPITPAGRHDPAPRPVRQADAPGSDEGLASRHRPLASLAALRAEERAAVRRSFGVAAAVIAVLMAGAALSVAMPSGGSDMVAFLQ